MDKTEVLKKSNVKDLAFVSAYFENNMNATRAYLALHPKSSYNNARSCAADILAKPNIKEEIRRRIDEKVMKSDEALLLLADMARGDVGDFIDRNNILDLTMAREKGLTKLIKKIKQRTITKIGKSDTDEDVEITDMEFELYSAKDAIDTILKVGGTLKDSNIEINVKLSDD